jgi:hypothetical protein
MERWKWTLMMIRTNNTIGNVSQIQVVFIADVAAFVARHHLSKEVHGGEEVIGYTIIT